ILVARLNQKTSYELFAVKHFGGATGDDWQTSGGTEETDAVPHDGLVRKVKNHALFLSMQQKAKAYAKDIIKNVIPKDVKIDVVISSACPFIEMLFGYELKKRLHCKWISDFRDLPFTDDRPHDAQRMKKRMQRRLKHAEAVITIAHFGKTFLSDGIVEDADKIHVITNGFSMTDASEPEQQDDGVLHIVHTGSLYGGTRKADLLFKATLAAKEANPSFCYTLECAGGNNETLIETAKQYGEDGFVHNRGFVPRDEALAMQRSADLLLALVINRPGSLVAKMFEYILNRKPVVCISRGKDFCSEETNFVEKLRLGVAVEEFQTDAVERLRDYLLMQFERKLAHEPMLYDPDTEEIRQYDHDQIVKRIEALCEAVAKA
ncbi:MAG: hypothetical protein IJD01_08545, partial [Clostridia bacterium]|nr:hypothetical protein [Clostridia bacterium]